MNIVRVRKALAMVLLAGIGAPVPGAAQSCRIQLTRMQMLGVEDSTAFFPFPSVAVLEDGRIVVSPDASGSRALVYERGRLAGTLGRRGSGPSEYAWAETVRQLRDGTIALVDPTLGKVDLYSRSLALQRSVHTFPGVHDAVSLRPDSAVVLGAITDRKGTGFPLHIMVRGTHVGSFGAPEAVSPSAPGADVEAARVLAVEGDTAFWLARLNTLRLERWTTAGARTKTWTLERAWFTPWRRRAGRREDEAPTQTIVTGLQLVQGAYVIVFVQVPERTWRPSSATGRRHGELAVLDRTQLREFVDTMLLAVRLSDGAVVAERREDDSVLPTTSPNAAFSWRELKSGVAVIDVHRLGVTC